MRFDLVKSTFLDVRVFVENNKNCSASDLPSWVEDTKALYYMIPLFTLIVLYSFLAIAIVCDEYCVPAVERLCYNLKISYDVAGATFLAVATSSPEFFANFFSTILTENDLGVGTIVGSSIFNSLAITAICSLYAGSDFWLDWWPLTRDLFWYSLAVFVLTIIIWDDFVLWWESLLLVALYILYVINLMFDKKLQATFRDKNRECRLKCFVPLGEVKDFVEMDDPEENDDEPFDFCHPPEDSKWKKVIWYLSYPLQLMFLLTIPNIHRDITHGCSSFCLIMSIVWIGILTYTCSVYLSYIGHGLKLPDVIMGIVVYAIGTSVPEAVASAIVTAKGYGSMALSNAISSNTVDIFVCLGVPWLLKTLFIGSKTYGYRVFIQNEGLVYNAAYLTTSALLLYVSFLITRFKFGIRIGIMCFILYLALTISSVIIDLDKAMPPCTQK